MYSKKQHFTLLILAIFGLSTLDLFGQELDKIETVSQFSLEIDPITFALDGYSFHLRYSPKSCDHLLLGLGVYAMDMPEQLVDFNSKNKGKGWDVRLDQGFGLFAEHHFKQVHDEWFVGVQLGLQDYSIEIDGINGSSEYTNLLTMSYIGYTWKWENGLYLKPWAGFGYTDKISGSNEIEDKEYDLAPIAMFATLHIGYSF